MNIKLEKLYFSIKEVGKLTGLKPYVLRYWESEFPTLNPVKNRAGKRTYRQKDIDLIFQIKELLYDRKFTIKGAIEELKGSSDRETPNDNQNNSTELDQRILHEIRQELNTILADLNRN